jgi:hypothetical protein
MFQISPLLIPEIVDCIHYPHLFHLDPVTTAIWLVSFGLIILSILRRTMAYASSVHNNLESLLSLLIITPASPFYKLRTCLRFQHDTALSIYLL